ncbi:TPA: hypothetical protein I8Y90_000386 [Legionella pneumophila]|nr:hypothetical protein [Legionella pneumophila]
MEEHDLSQNAVLKTLVLCLISLFPPTHFWNIFVYYEKNTKPLYGILINPSAMEDRHTKIPLSLQTWHAPSWTFALVAERQLYWLWRGQINKDAK